MNTFSEQDIKENKTKAGLGYILFFLPLILCKDSKLGRSCANQGLLLFIAGILARMILDAFRVVPLLGWLFSLAANLSQVAVLVYALLCYLQLITNERFTELPVIGHFIIIS